MHQSRKSHVCRHCLEESSIRPFFVLSALRLRASRLLAGPFRRKSLRLEAFGHIVVFAADKIADRATFETSKEYCTGVECVLVNGVPVVDGGEHTGARPGMAVMGPGYVLGRA